MHAAADIVVAASQRATPGLYINVDIVKRVLPDIEIESDTLAIARAASALNRANVAFCTIPCEGRA